MNHVLKMVPAGNTFAQQSSLVDSTLLIAPEVPRAVAALAREAMESAPAQRRARARAAARAAAAWTLRPPAVLDSLLAAEYAAATNVKLGTWARRFAAADSIVYLFGPKSGGYVATGSLVDDRHQDCVSLLYRVSELARARAGDDAVSWALRTRFAGAEPAAIIDAEGRVDYDDPAHLDFSLDMIRTGLWGRDVTGQLTGVQPDTVGTERYPADSFRFVPKAELEPAELAEGDVVWFVLDPQQDKAARLRREYGLVIGHIGLVVLDDGKPMLVHAAASGLAGWYEGGTVVKVPLTEYLARVGKFAGVMVTRF